MPKLQRIKILQSSIQSGMKSIEKNCRCTMITEFDGFEKSKEELNLDKELKEMEFEAWIKNHK